MKLVCEDVAVDLGLGPVLRGVSLAVGRGDWLCVIGPNGAGKSTLVRAIVGAVHASGRILLGDRSPSSLTPAERARRVAMVPQAPVIPPGVTVFDYVLLGRTPHLGLGLRPALADVDTVRATLDRLDLTALARRRVDAVSGGERQRVVIARALAQEAPILALDEPTSSLDIGHQLDVLELVDELRAERGLTVLTTLHDLSLAGQFAQRLALLVAGRIVADGPPATVLTPDTIAAHYGVQVDVVGNGAGGTPRRTVVVTRRTAR